MKKPKKIRYWTEEEVQKYLASRGHKPKYLQLFQEHKIDGKSLMLLTEYDLRDFLGVKVLGDLKRLLYDIVLLQKVQQRNKRRRRRNFPSSSSSSSSSPSDTGDPTEFSDEEISTLVKETHILQHQPVAATPTTLLEPNHTPQQLLNSSPPRKHAHNLQPEFFKALVAMLYLFIVTWITALVMVIVHDRVPDMEKFPPLPDLFLDNMPHIPWAFEMCEVTGTILLFLWAGVLIFHKHRFILLRRFFALSGTVFLLRCFTMLITSLSVPGTHLKCNPRPFGDWMTRLYNAYLIWKGLGMSIQGVRTCGDYMFSGHTVALTMLNFFVTEYTTRRLYFIHTFSWLLNTFGIFFILAAHEHYSIDVFFAFYITSRLFLYYHTLANNQALMQRDSKRTKVWFPLFSYFESGVDGIVPNVYEWPIKMKYFKHTKNFLHKLLGATKDKLKVKKRD